MKKFKIFVSDIDGTVLETLIINEEQRKLLEHLLSADYIDDYYHMGIDEIEGKIIDMTVED